MAWTRMEMAEVALIAAGTGGTWALSGGFAWSPSYGKLICYAAVLLLGQGLVRDLVKKATRPKVERDPDQPIQKCLCAESSLGVLMILAGTLVLLSGIERELAVDRGLLTGVVGGILAVGFLIKDYVFSVGAGGVSVRKEKDHDNVLIW